jgi:hypothetical protein
MWDIGLSKIFDETIRQGIYKDKHYHLVAGVNKIK